MNQGSEIRQLLGFGPSHEQRARVGRSQAKPARARAISRRLTEYIRLACGHYTTREAAEQAKFWAPPKKPYLCETCDEYVARARKPRKARIPDEPPF